MLGITGTVLITVTVFPGMIFPIAVVPMGDDDIDDNDWPAGIIQKPTYEFRLGPRPVFVTATCAIVDAPLSSEAGLTLSPPTARPPIEPANSLSRLPRTTVSTITNMISVRRRVCLVTISCPPSLKTLTPGE